MSDWKFIETQPAEQFCRIEYFGVRKDDLEFVVTVREFHQPPDPAMPFFAQADKQVNQNSAAYTPSGWGSTQNDALWECLKAIRKFPYQP
jgi:hypothetical protein